MKKLLIILIIPLLVGCFTTYKPVSTMYDWELRGEYNDLQIQQLRWEREMMYGKRTYTSSGNTSTSGGGAWGAFARGLGSKSTVENPAIKKLYKVEKRIRDIELEMSRRGVLP